MITEIPKLGIGGIKGRFVVKSKDGRNEGMKEYKNGKFFSITIGNKTGEIPLKYWGSKGSEKVEEIYSSIEVGDIIEVGGKVVNDSFSKCLAVHINEDVKYGEEKGYIKKLAKEELMATDLAEFVRSLPEEQIETMALELRELVESIEDESIKELLKKFFFDEAFASKFNSSPAAKSRHHAYLGGLLEHSLNVAKLCEKLASSYNLNRSLLIAGALLHDIGKMREYVIKGGAVDISEEGKLIGHIIIGEEQIRSKIEEIGNFPADSKMKLLHMIISHHGGLEEAESGSAKKPSTPEALALYLCDLADSQVKNMLENDA